MADKEKNLFLMNSAGSGYLFQSEDDIPSYFFDEHGYPKAGVSHFKIIGRHDWEYAPVVNSMGFTFNSRDLDMAIAMASRPDNFIYCYRDLSMVAKKNLRKNYEAHVRDVVKEVFKDDIDRYFKTTPEPEPEAIKDLVDFYLSEESVEESLEVASWFWYSIKGVPVLRD